MENVKVLASDKLALDVIVSEAKDAKANVLIMHGMAEHKERYLPLIKRLNENGYNVVISDMRGHGGSVNDEFILGHLGPKELIVDDYLTLTKYMKDRFPKLHNYLFAHSMGTLNAREFLMNHDDEFEKVILSGTVAPVGVAGLAAGMARRRAKKNPKGYSKLLFALSNGGSTKEDLSWLSYNEDNVKAYLANPLCGFKFTNMANVVLFSETADLAKAKEYKCKNKDLKILSISGSDDRTTAGTKGLMRTVKCLNNAGYQNVRFIEYPKMKHEILMEHDNEQVYKDILDFYAE